MTLKYCTACHKQVGDFDRCWNSRCEMFGRPQPPLTARRVRIAGVKPLARFYRAKTKTKRISKKEWIEVPL